MYDQSTVISLLREISTKLSTVISNQSTVISNQSAFSLGFDRIEKLLLFLAISLSVFSFSFILKGWLKK